MQTNKLNIKKLKKRCGLHFLLSVMVFTFAGITSGYARAQTTPVIVEITSIIGTTPDAHLLAQVCRDHHIKPTSLYQWHNHLVIYGFLNEPKQLETELRKLFPKCGVKIYEHPYYNFDRKRCCGGKIARQLDNILLTADLVKDPKMQQEYLHYHAIQFKEWPGVAQGFCHADFQQLLGYKNGRQLILVISIPKGERLDKLNPKTTENNPEMMKWNKLMKKYQVGIPGTKRGEVWVFLKPLNNL